MLLTLLQIHNDEMLSEICVCGKVYFMLKCSILSTCTPLLVCLNCRYPIYIQYSYSTVFNTFTVGNIVYCVLIYICRPLLKRFTKSHAWPTFFLLHCPVLKLESQQLSSLVFSLVDLHRLYGIIGSLGSRFERRRIQIPDSDIAIITAAHYTILSHLHGKYNKGKQ